MSTKPPIEKRLKICDDEFQIIDTSQFESLPNEILVKIFDFIKVKDLIRCGQVSRRIRTIAHDHSLWPKINPRPKDIVPVGLIVLIGIVAIGLMTGWVVIGLVFKCHWFPALC